MDNKLILDPCCGSRMFWFDKNNPDVEFCDIRELDTESIWKSGDGQSVRYCTVKPDRICSVTDLPFEDNTFWHVVFDPPHLLRLGDTSWMAKKYGKLTEDTWRNFIHDGFCECMRVLKPNGTLIFKWSETDIKLSEVLKVIPYKPLYGHRSGRHMTTLWMAFMKIPDGGDANA